MQYGKPTAREIEGLTIQSCRIGCAPRQDSVVRPQRIGGGPVAGVTSGLIGLHEEVTWEARHLGIRQRPLGTAAVDGFAVLTHLSAAQSGPQAAGEAAQASHMATEWVKESLPVSMRLVTGKFDIKQYVTPGQEPVKLTFG